MYIPKYRVVDVVELAKELDNYHVDADDNGNDDLVDKLYFYLAANNDSYADDHIRWSNDSDWEIVPESIKEAYDYLVSMYGFQHGDCFLWYFSE